MQTLMRIVALMSVFAAMSAQDATAAADVRVYALVVGADHYKNFPELHGAVNDATLIAKTLKEAGADEVDMLIESNVTRQALFERLKALIAKARPGDWVFFTYAGHGGRERLKTTGELVDTFMLPGYGDAAPANGERIINHELRTIFASAPDVNVLFLADSCHSASMARGWDSRAAPPSLRAVGQYGPVDDVLTPPPAASGPSDLPNVVFIGAALDNQDAPEISFDGQYHGATSWFFAKALRGEAGGVSGRTTFADLSRFIEVDARNAAGSRQMPQVKFAEPRGREPLPFAAIVRSPDDGSDIRPPTPVLVSGGGTIAGVSGVKVVSRADEAEFIWDPKTGTVVHNRLGDLVAEGISDVELLKGVIGKWRALPELYEMSASHPMDVKIGPQASGARYMAFQEADISVSMPPSSSLAYLTVVDLASTGEVQNLTQPDDTDADRLFRNVVCPPFGADHVIAIATAERPDELRAALNAFDGRALAVEFAGALRAALKNKTYALGVGQLYTGPDPGRSAGEQSAPACQKRA